MEILLVLGCIVCGVLWHRYRGETASRWAAQREWLVESILTEAEGVVMDFLDYGKEVSQATRGKYRGTISVRIHRIDKSAEMGFYISMYDSGDLERLDKMVLSRFHLEGFARKYGYYYDPERDSIVYQSSRGVKLQPGEKAELERILSQRIQNHPMAIVKSDTLIYTRGI